MFNQLESYRSYILVVLENVSREEAEVIPKGFNNNIRWNLGHIYLDQYLWIHINFIYKEPPYEGSFLIIRFHWLKIGLGE
ncbi:DinB family protein [Neobacillus driksii]|uniref:DinB family protein n=1 Tax=Neobacillus driksii TaxID=3035913 RepID=UPI0035BBF7AC